MQLKRYGIPIQKISKIFISHLHGDHYLGLTGLLFSMHLQRRTTELHIYSQPGLDEIITLQLKHSKSVLNYPLTFHPILSDPTYCLFEDEAIAIYTIPLIHKVSCTGFLFREKLKPRKIDKDKLVKDMKLEHIAQLKKGQDIYNDDGSVLYKNEDFTLPPRPSYSYAYCSDTVYNKEIIELVAKVDLLYHESTFMDEHEDKAKLTLHTTASQAAKIASQAKVKNLLLGHFSARYKDLNPLLEEAKALFKNTHLATEGETFDLEKL